MWIAPAAALVASSVSLLSSRGLPTVTGTSATLGSLSSPRSNARRHLNTWFAFTPWACATWATLAPGFSVNCTIWSFSEIDRKRRTRRPVLNPTASGMSRSSVLHYHSRYKGLGVRLPLFSDRQESSGTF